MSRSQRFLVGWGCCLCICFCLGMGTVRGEGETAGPEQIQRWVEELNAPSRRVRHEAEQHLIRQGVAILPQLREAVPLAPVGSQLLLGQIERQIQLAAADALLKSPGSFRVSGTLLPPKNPERPGRTARFQLSVDAIPGIRPEFVTVRDGKFSFIGGAPPLNPFDTEAKRQFNFDGQHVEFTLDLLRPDDGVVSSGTLIGEVQVQCGALREELRFPLDTATESVRIAGENSARVLSLAESAEGLEVTLVITYPEGTKWESHRLAQLHREAWLELADGKRIEPTSQRLFHEATRSHEVRYRFPGEAGEWTGGTFVYVTPVTHATVTVPVSIQIPAPAGGKD